MKDAALLLLCALALAHGVELKTARTCNCDPSEAQQICQANFDNDNVLIAHENCDKFYKCTNGKPVAYSCPENLLYNPFTEECDWPNNVDCGDRPISDGTDTDDADCDDDNSDGAGNDNGNGDDDNNSDNSNTCNCNPSEAPSICAADGSDGVLVAHENCTQFYMCAEGRPVAFFCPPNLLYNPYNEECDWPQNVECGDRVIPERDDDADAGNDSDNEDNGGNDNGDNDGTCNCNPDEAPTICAAADSDGVLVAHENCNQFYVCDNGKPVVFSCPGTLLYNPYTEQCDWPRNVDCGNRVEPETEGGCSSCNDSGDSSDIDDSLLPDDDAGNDSSDTDNVPPPDNDDGSDSADIDDAPPAGDDAGNDGTDIDDVPPPGDDDGIDGPDIDDALPPGDDGGNDSNDIDDVPPPGDDDGNDDDVSNDNDNIGAGNCDPSEAPTICAAEDSDSVLVAHENCNQFYVCSDGKPVALKCPGNLLFNPNTDRCDWPEKVECGDRVIPDPDDNNDSNDNPGNESDENNNEGSDNDNGSIDNEDSDTENDGNDNGGAGNCDPSEAPSICAADESDGILVAHENCNQFYKCFAGKPIALKCPANLMFNPNTDQCDWAENVDCGDRVIPDPEDDNNDIDDDISNDNDGNDSNGNDNGSNDNDANDNDGNDSVGNDNGNDDNAGGGNCDPNEAPIICAADDSDSVLVAHENCNQFYICSGGKPVALTCPGNLLFNPKTDQCDWPYNVDCGDRVIPDPDDSDSGIDNDSNDSGGNDNGGSDNDSDNGSNDETTCNCNPEDAPAICATEDSSGILIAHENCNQFYKCDHGKPVAFTCPGNLLYNPYTESCDWPQNVDCGDRVIPDPNDSDSGNESVENDSDGNDNGGSDNENDNDGIGNENDNGGNDNSTCNCNPEEAPAICATEDSSGVLIAHENCNQFYKCDHGKPVTFTCPGNLLYNPYTERCDWPQNVDCGDRVTPDLNDNDSGNNSGENDSGGNDDGGSDNENDSNGSENGGSDDENDNDGIDSENDNGGNDNSTCNCNPEEAPSICATEDSSGVLVAHENCNQFYKCDHGKPVTFTCPGNLLYNPYTESCDWPENVDCGDRVIPDPDDSDSGNDSGESDSGGNDNSGGDNDNDNGSSGSENDNDGIDNENDNGGNDNSTCNCNPEEAPSICATEDSSGILVAHENCNQFYKCDHGKPVAFTCPGNLLYNPYTEKCDWPENVDCGDRIIPDPEEGDADSDDNEVDDNGPSDSNDSDNNNNSGNDSETDPDDNLGNDDGGNESSNDPDDNLGNDSDGNDSDNNPNDSNGNDSDNNSNDSDCDDNDENNSDETCNCKPDEAPSICAIDGSDGVLIAHENCNQFYKCDNGKPVAFRCPSNLLYNPVTEECDWAVNVECGDRVIPDSEDEDDNGNDEDNVSDSSEAEDNDNGGTCNCNPEEAPAICAVDGSEGVLIAHENCTQFYMCSFGKPVAIRCPPNLLYNPYKEACDWPDNVDCGNRLIPELEEDSDDDKSEVDESDSGNNDINDDPSQAPSICAESGSNGVLVAHENCNQFYICSSGSPIVISCAGELLFNPITQQCDWPRNVDCGDRIVPGGNNDDDCACNPRNAPVLCSRPNSNGKLIAHENCNQFYICDEGVPVARNCASNLHYNIDKEVCDWPQNVNCNSRMLSYPSLNKHLESRQTLRK